MTTYSFHPVKQVTTGEGGAIVTTDKRLYEALISFRSHGITRDPAKLLQNRGPWYYEQQSLGYNYRLTDFQAALGTSQLKKLPQFLQKRREIARQYTAAFNGLPGMIAPWQSPAGESAWHLYVLRLAIERLNVGRDVIFQELWDKGIGVNVHYIPVYWHPYYQQLGFIKGICPIAETVFESMITLPLYPGLSEADVEYVIHNVQTVIQSHLN